MPEIFIPFEHGQSEAVDPKLLPQGLFLSAQNVRYAKDGRLAVRNGYRTLTTLVSTLGAGSLDTKFDCAIQPATAAAQPFAQFILPNAQSAGTTFNTPTPGVLGVVEANIVEESFPPTIVLSAVDTLSISSTKVVVAFTGYDPTTKLQATPVPGASGATYVLANIDPNENAVVASTYDTTVADASNIKMLLVNSVVMVFVASPSANTIVLHTYDTSLTPIAGPITVATATSGRAQYFDVSAGGAATEAYLVYPSAANTLSFGTVTTAGVYAALSTIATTSVEPRPSIAPTGLAPTDQIVIVWNDGASFTTGNVKYTVYRRSTTSFLIGTTTVFAGGNATGYPVVSGNATDDWIGAFNTAATATVPRMMQTFTSAAMKTYLYNVQLASKPFLSGVSRLLLVTDTDDAAALPGAYYAVNAVSLVGLLAIADTSFALLKARPSDTAATLCDPRRTVQVGLTAIGREPNLSALLVGLPTRTSDKSGWSLFRSEYGSRAEMHSAANLNGQLFFSGGRVTATDGAKIYDVGLSLPEPVTLVAAAGTIAAGTYQVVIVWEWTDGRGRRTRSAPSLPVSITLAGAGGITVNVNTHPHTTTRFVNNVTQQVNMRIYRTTLATPSIFRDAVGAPVTAQALDPSSLQIFGATTLTLTDTQIATNEILYTQGARGGLSGFLQNDRPCGARYICAGANRLLIGGMEDSSEVWWSKLAFPGEQLAFSNNAVYKARVDGRVTAVAEMDGTWLIATAYNWWQVTGDGPDDTGANGSFSPPARLPADIGCINHKSVVVTNGGLMFQGRTDGIYLLPRGGGGPTAIGWPVRDTLTSFPFVAASVFNRAKNLAYFAVINTADTAGRLLVYDTRLDTWYVDSFLARPIHSLSIYNDLLHIDGTALETVGNFQDTDNASPTTVLPSLTTGDIRPFGFNGRGRVRKVTLLGERRSATAVPTLEVSYDSGKTFGESVSWPIASLAAANGDAFEAEHCLATPKGDSYRFRLAWTAASAVEGIVWNGLSLEVYPERGLTRLNDAKRA